MKQKNYKEIIKRVLKYCFCIGFICNLVYFWATCTSRPIEYEKFAPLIFKTSIIFLMIKILFTDYSCKERIISVLFVVLSIATWKSSGMDVILLQILIVAAMKDIEMEDIVKCIFFTAITMMSIGITHILLFNREAIVMVQEFGRGGIETRFRMGSGHPNGLHIQFFWVLLSFLMLTHKKLRYYMWMILQVFNTELFLLTKSRTGFLGCTVTIVGFAIFHYIKPLQKYKIGYIFLQIGATIVVAISMIPSFWNILSQSTKLWELNQMMTGRLWQAAEIIKMYGYSVFGVKLPGDIVFDMGSTRVLVQFGIIVFAMVSVGTIISFIYLMKKQRWDIAMALFAVCLYTITEWPYYLGCDLRMIIVGYVVYQWMDTRKKKGMKDNEMQ